MARNILLGLIDLNEPAVLIKASMKVLPDSPELALLLANRACDLGSRPLAEALALRFQLTKLLGLECATRDLDELLDRFPRSTISSLAALSHPNAEVRLTAAIRLWKGTASESIKQRAESILLQGYAGVAFGASLNGRLNGWFACQRAPDISWPEKPEARFEIQTRLLDKRETVHLSFACRGTFSAIDVPDGQWFGLSLDPSSLKLCHERAFDSAPAKQRILQQASIRACVPARSVQIDVIVPVYEDFEATRNCLEALGKAQATGARLRIIAVNDCSPNAEIEGYLAANADRFLILNLPTNLGFAGAVNAGLAYSENNDVLLLNSDTLPSHIAIARMSNAAYSQADIGTVTPLSNNGELVSVPLPFQPNAMIGEEKAHVLMSDMQPAVIDLPSGIGFCLYIRHDCLAATGQISEDFGRGYAEDVDFCFRARKLGFRNVCALDAYVPHIGSRSFGAAKAQLVMKNLDRLERRYPGQDAETTAFVAADPLLAHRLRFLCRGGKAILILGNYNQRSTVEARCAQVPSDIPIYAAFVQAGIIDVYARNQSGSLFRVHSAAWSQSLLVSIVRNLGCTQIALVHPTLTLTQAELRPLVMNAANGIAPWADTRGQRSGAKKVFHGCERLVVVPVVFDQVTDQLLRSLAIALPLQDIPQILVIGTTPRDEAYMSTGRVFVTGPLRNSDVLQVSDRFQGRAIYIHGDSDATNRPDVPRMLASGLPVAHHFSKRGSINPATELMIGPRRSGPDVVCKILAWFGSLPSRDGVTHQ